MKNWQLAIGVLCVLLIIILIPYGSLKKLWNDAHASYSSSIVDSDTQIFTPIEWQDLIPSKERDIIAQYQVNDGTSALDIADQILASIEAASDKDYQNALISTNTVSAYNNMGVEISGYLVPLDLYESKAPKNALVVPYFGACLHFPPPPPNQIIFIQLEDGFKDFDINQAYTLKGLLTEDLFEDPIGTSAYALDVAIINPFFEQPDTFRTHNPTY